jgi:branched-chain amino acid transport system ATP-binding protein
MSLRVDNIKAGYGDKSIIDGVSFAVEPGQIMGLFGHNGAGKSTTLRAIFGLIPTSQGEMWLDDTRIDRLSVSTRIECGLRMLPEGRGVFADLTVQENLAVVSAANPTNGRAGTSIDDTFALFPVLAEKRRALAGSMSGGQQQMLAVVRSYLGSSDLILIDEVSMGLAPVVVDEIFAFISDLSASGTSMLLVEQYVARVLAIASHVYVLNQGSITLSATAEEVRGSDLFDHYMATGAAPATGPRQTGGTTDLA